jgi:hypothetical protein
MSNDGSGYRPSAGEQRAQDFAAKKLGEALNGHGTSVPVDWGRLGAVADRGAVGGDSNGDDGGVADSIAIPADAIRFLCDYGIPLGATTTDWLLNREKVMRWLLGI